MSNLFSNQLLEGAYNCVVNCGLIDRGQNVLILNITNDTANRVDDMAVHALATVCQQVGAKVQVLWTSGMEKGWWDTVPPIVLGAFRAADIVINNTMAIGRPLKPIREAMFQHGVTMIRNMATTTEVLSSEWARFPFALSDEITKRTGEVIENGSTWRVVHPNGTDITGRFGRPSPTQSGFTKYNTYRRETRNRPFPQGCCIPITSLDANGVIIFDRSLPWESRHVGIGELQFNPVKVTVENNRMVNFEGGYEADALRSFFQETSKHIGEDAWNLSSFHSGIHPKAKIYEAPEKNPDFWHRAVHNNPGVMHFHLGGSKLKKDYDYPFMFHISVELDNATVFVEGEKLWDAGHLTVLDDPEVKDLASKFGNSNELLRQINLRD